MDAPFEKITFGSNSRTDQQNWVWTENILMALEALFDEALRYGRDTVDRLAHVS